MKNIMNICRICLRLDRKLKPIDGKLLEYHDQLCEYSVYTLNPLYCTECEYLLRKSYYFKKKCMKAIEVFDTWKKSKENEKKPVEHLCTLLPIPLGVWVRSNNTTCLWYEFDEDHSSSVICEPKTNEICHNDIYANDTIKLEAEIESDLIDLIKTEGFTKKLEKNDTQHNSIEVIEICHDFIKKETEINFQIDYESEKNDNDGRWQNATNEDIDTFDSLSVCDDVDSEDDLTLTALKLKKKIKDTEKKSVKKTKEGKKSVKKRTAAKNEKSSKRKKNSEPLQFSKERLITQLEAKFEAWGDITTEDGTVIDKDVILGCLQDKITDERMRQLWDSIQCDQPEPITIRTLKHIIRNYGNEEHYTSVFEIEYLNTETKMVEELQRRQTYECYIKAKYKCEKCFLVFYKPKHLKNHMTLHEATAGEFVCPICDIRYASGKNYRGHLAAHSAVYRCKLCPLVTYYRDSMVNHFDQHQGKAYTCDICGNVAKSMSAYKRHQYLLHRRGRHVCTACGRAFVSSLGVSLHKKRMHQNEAPPTDGQSVACSECELTFPSEEVLMKHKKTWHQAHKNTKKPRKVPRKKQKPPSITCRACGASGSIGWLTLHFRTEHPTLDMAAVYADKRKHLCHYCAKGFWNASSLRYHLNTHTGDRPYACDLCPKRCHSTIALNEHRLRHFPPSKECQECGKKFRTHSNLYNHTLFHNGARRHKCDICGKAFLHSTSLREHVQGVHYNVRRVKRRNNEPRDVRELPSEGDATE